MNVIRILEELDSKKNRIILYCLTSMAAVGITLWGAMYHDKILIVQILFTVAMLVANTSHVIRVWLNYILTVSLLVLEVLAIAQTHGGLVCDGAVAGLISSFWLDIMFFVSGGMLYLLIFSSRIRRNILIYPVVFVLMLLAMTVCIGDSISKGEVNSEKLEIKPDTQYYILSSVNKNYALTANENTGALTLQVYRGKHSQLFTFDLSDTSGYNINTVNNKTFDVQYAVMEPGSQVVIYENLDNSYQKWHTIQFEDGTVALVTDIGTIPMEIQLNGDISGSNVKLGEWNQSYEQRFVIKEYRQELLLSDILAENMTLQNRKYYFLFSICMCIISICTNCFFSTVYVQGLKPQNNSKQMQDVVVRRRKRKKRRR